jgi:hypothetical protein
VTPVGSPRNAMPRRLGGETPAQRAHSPQTPQSHPVADPPHASAIRHRPILITTAQIVNSFVTKEKPLNYP